MKPKPKIKPVKAWAIFNDYGIWFTLIRTELLVAKQDATQTIGLPWNTLKKQGYRAIRVEIRAIEK